MNYKKLFFPIGGGDELEERLYAALLLAKTLDTKLEILKCGLKSNINMYKTLSLPKDILNKIDEVVDNKYDDENIEFKLLFEKVAKKIGINIDDTSSQENAFAYLKIKEGIRSTLIEQESKFCDLVIAAAPPSGVTTATFETAVLKSGKPVLMFPRIMKNFSVNSIIIGWNNSTEASRALTSSISLLKKAQRVHIVSSPQYIEDSQIMQNLIDYLKEHEIDASFEIVETTKIPGQALLNAALDGNFDLIVAGAYGHKGLKELMFGGATRYLLEKSTLPIFMTH
ncbi:universal stress protein [Poseidonibacter lekithochrous]|uniref:universal stress protein n=1 Tax=Poseidonibacter TaxID=2321187 RepID=UPI001C0A2D07|nr:MULTISPECIES: universal stress protein [Poseidonibacter]MBU3015931.1 universal stress protein [Poseidonibacter lekithochrous]MDO6829230.1 universal stress protein [Poseidonibacter sp. 1_MG-2023]